jgi:hypothetical protein
MAPSLMSKLDWVSDMGMLPAIRCADADAPTPLVLPPPPPLPAGPPPPPPPAFGCGAALDAFL